MYGLGSLVKSITKPIKSVAKGIGKFAKSDLGKAALTAAAIYYGGGGAIGPFQRAGMSGFQFGNLPGASFFGKGSFNPLKQLVSSEGFTGLGPSKFGQFLGSKLGGNLIKGAALTIPSVLAAAGVQEEEVGDLQQDKEKLAKLLERGYRNLNINASDEEVDAFVRANVAEGGRIGYAMGSAEENAMQASGIMGLPLNENPAGVTELDLRETGGFIPPVGVKEKADDIPAMLSNNEFVFTADAVRGMGDGDVDKGAERMYAMMKTLENGGRV
jgi:hypothetical protein